MKKIQVTIKEKDKKGKNLSILNLRDEVVNFLYKDTVANATKADMQFFILLFFSLIKVKDKTLLEEILNEGIPKFNKLNKVFSSKKGYLRPGEYGEIFKEQGLDTLFKNDVFFVLVEAILNIKEIKKQFESFLIKNDELRLLITKLETQYLLDLEGGLLDFKNTKIEDSRYDDSGNYHDLSKSVYRTVKMRSSRNLDLNLQKYTTIKSITSESPVTLIFLQNIDPQIIFDLWDKYHLAEYVRGVAGDAWNIAHNHIDFNVNLGDLINAWLIYKLIPSNNRKEKNKGRKDFEDSKIKNKNTVEELNLKLVQSVLHANERLEKEIESERTKVQELLSIHVAIQDKEKIKKLEERIAQLDNLYIKSELIDDK